jgi:hypothetical protein
MSGLRERAFGTLFERFADKDGIGYIFIACSTRFSPRGRNQIIDPPRRIRSGHIENASFESPVVE